MLDMTSIYIFMPLDYYGLKHSGLYRTGHNRNYRNCGPAQISV
jgi:hypothetical protein